MIPEIKPVNNWTGNSLTTKFDFDFLINSESELKVLHTNKNGFQTELQANIDYSIDQIGSPDGSFITFPLAGSSFNILSEDEIITLSLNLPLAQTVPFGTSAKLNLNSLEYAFDYLVRLIQIESRKIERTVKVQEGSDVTPEALLNSIETSEENSLINANYSAEQANIAFQKASEASDSAISAEAWATKLEDTVDGTEYSAKHYAMLASDTVQGSLADIEMARVDSIESIQNQTTSSVNQINTTKDDAISTITSTKNTAVSNINTEESSAITAINNQKTTAVDTITSTKNTAVSTVNSAKNTAISNISTEETDAINAVKAEGTTQKNSLQGYVNTASSYATNAKNSQELAKKWAVSDSIVENGLRSAKYYAQHAQGLSDVTYEHLRASRAYEDKGAVLSDEEGFATVQEYKHSTFDLSKFTVIGSPTISDDGVVSGFSSNNYLMLDVSVVSKLLVGDFKFHFKFKTMETVSGALILGGGDELGGTFSLWISNSQVAPIIYLDNNGTVQRSPLGNIENANILANTEYECYFGKKGNNYGFGIKKVGDSNYITSKGFDSSYSICAKTQLICKSNGKFSIPLGSMSIISNGYPVFNGNKNGLDIIKSDDYTVVGSPMITEDGNVSGFNTSNFISIPMFDVTKPNYRVDCVCNYATGTGQNFFFGGNWSVGPYRFAIISNINKLALYMGSDGTSWNIASLQYGKTILENNTTYKVSFIRENGTVYKVVLKNLKTNIETTEIVVSSTEDLVNNISAPLYIGASGWTPFAGLIDLNLFKIYVDGNLVYQPCLKVPYTESKTGSKIVDAVYRDRVEDVYEQFGIEYLYYTIDENSKNFTLPMGEVYGMLATSSDRISVLEEEQHIQNMFLTGEISNNKKGYEQVENMYHSTFDLSKFTVVGSPNITSDGVVSNINANNYITFTKNITPSNNIELYFNGSTDTLVGPTVGENPLLTLLNDNNVEIALFEIRASGTNNEVPNFFIALKEADGTSIFANYIATNLIWKENVLYYFRFKFDGEKYTVARKTINTDYEVFYTINSTTQLGTVSKGYIGRRYANSTYNKGQIDLKQFSITVDGVPVFNGNKTGLDVIKPDDYTVVGTPTITDDGVASGFSANSYLTKELNLTNYSSLEILGDFIINGNRAGVHTVPLFLDTSTNACKSRIELRQPNFMTENSETYEIVLRLSSIGDSYDIGDIKNSSIKINANTRYFYKITFSKGIYTFAISKDKKNWTVIGSRNSTLLPIINTIALGSMNESEQYLDGSIDLNEFEINFDGNLVYKPCLKIPYNVSKTGSKIVDAVYRDRVQDVYEQYGQAKYFTLDEENKNFTLPMGNLYSMIGQRSLVSSTVTDTSRVDIFSDKTCLVCGNVTTSGTINLPIELANSNYFLTLPASVKTSTSFTTTSTGDYILIGKVV